MTDIHLLALFAIGIAYCLFAMVTAMQPATELTYICEWNVTEIRTVHRKLEY